MSNELYERERALIIQVARDIRQVKACTSFDHRHFLGEIFTRLRPYHLSAYELEQGKLMYALGLTLRPRRVYEIGIGHGITAHSLISACGQDLDYYGVDSMPTHFDPEFPTVDAVKQTIATISCRLDSVGGQYQFDTRDSDTIPEFVHPRGRIDLIHVDGDHSFEHQKRDIQKAIRSGAEWMLVDDCNDTEVVLACFDAWKAEWNKSWRGGLLPMVYFEDSRTGSYLFRTGMWNGAS